MPTNVPPQYHEAEDRFRRANSTPEKIAAVQEMLAMMPKHKGTDHLKAQLRTRLSHLMTELERPSKGTSGGQIEPFSIPREGGGRATLIGATNVGKSLLLAKATGAHTKVGPYSLSTQEPIPGMLRYKDIYIQIIDAPAISNMSTQTRLYGLLRNSDVFVIVIDLTQGYRSQVEYIFGELERWGFELTTRQQRQDVEHPWAIKPVILVGNKADMPDSLEQFLELQLTFGDVFPVVMVSAEESVGLEELGQEIFNSLNVIRVYTKPPREKIDQFDRKDPLVLPIGSTVAEAAEQVHKHLRSGLKYAVLWGSSGKFLGQRVGRGHELVDQDVIEFHV